MQLDLRNATLHELLAAYSAPGVSPAGISAGALSAAVGAALILKVARISERKISPGPELEKVQMVASKVERLRNMLEDVVDQDAEAYGRLVRIKSAHTKGLESFETVERALKTVTLLPGAMGRAAMICINLADELVDVAYPVVLSDLYMGAWLCRAGVEASLMALNHNLEEISDTAFCEKIRSKLDFFDHRNDVLERIEAIAKERKRIAQAVGDKNGSQSEPGTEKR